MNMKSVSRLLRSQTNINKNLNICVSRGKNEWESDRTRYNEIDEHEPPKQDEILSTFVKIFINFLFRFII